MPDVPTSARFINTTADKVTHEAGSRAVQSMPLTTRSARLIGMLSTHYRTPGEPSYPELRLLDLVSGRTFNKPGCA